MSRYRLPPVVAGALWLLVLSACRGGPPAEEFPTPGVDVVSYDARLRLDPVTRYITADIGLSVRHPPALGGLSLSLDSELEILNVRVDEIGSDYERSGDRLVIPISNNDSSYVEIRYAGYVEGGLIQAEAAGQEVTFSQSWPEHGSGWLVGVHHPSDPARFDLELTVPSLYSVAASGALVRSEPHSGGTWRRHSYVLDTDAPTYTFAFAVADSFVVTQDETDSGIPIEHHVLEADQASVSMLRRTATMLDTLEALLGPYPYVTYATVEVPMRYAGMENASASFLSSDLYRNEAAGRNLLEEVNIHEAAHQWFGNDVSPSDWAQLWLSEGFATYLTTVVYERMDGAAKAREQRVRMAELANQDAHRRLVPEAYDDPEDILSATVYQKGGSMLHLLRLALGDEVFFAALRRIAIEFADQPFSTIALLTLLENESGRDLDPIFDYWVYGTEIPTLYTTWDRQARRLSWRIDDDNRTLADVPFELLVEQQNQTYVLNALDGGAILSGQDEPRVRPVGILIDVRD